MEHLHDPYVLQLIEALSRQQDRIEELEERDKSREGAEHYGPYGANCMYTGQLDAGECWLCYAKRKKQEAAEMQLVAGRYQYQFEHAMKALNSVEDVFEYVYVNMTPDQLRVTVLTELNKFTDAVSKVQDKK
jgi:hypothetical protein